jgi:hypothetical protein
MDLFALFKGPIATDLDNSREAFLPADPTVPGKNVYPWGVSKAEIEVFLQQYPELFINTKAAWDAALAPAFHDDLTMDGSSKKCWPCSTLETPNSLPHLLINTLPGAPIFRG